MTASGSSKEHLYGKDKMKRKPEHSKVRKSLWQHWKGSLISYSCRAGIAEDQGVATILLLLPLSPVHQVPYAKISYVTVLGRCKERDEPYEMG